MDMVIPGAPRFWSSSSQPGQSQTRSLTRDSEMKHSSVVVDILWSWNIKTWNHDRPTKINEDRQKQIASLWGWWWKYETWNHQQRLHLELISLVEKMQRVAIWVKLFNLKPIKETVPGQSNVSRGLKASANVDCSRRDVLSPGATGGLAATWPSTIPCKFCDERNSRVTCAPQLNHKHS